MKRIVIVDDERHLCESVSFALSQEGFECNYFTNPRKAMDFLQDNLPELVILDIVMPGMDGFEICRELRKQSVTLPIIFLSSKDEEFDRVLGLEMGADDYLCKPFSMKELIARIKVNIRRSRFLKDPSQTSINAIKHGELIIDEDTYSASYCGQPLKLTITEFRILHALLVEAGKVNTREHLLNKAFPLDYHVNDRTIDTHIKRIRKKLVAINPKAEPIETVFGVGYKFNI